MVSQMAFAPIMLAVAAIAPAAAQDFQKTYRIEAGGSISVRNVSGDVVITGYDGDAVMVSGTREGRDREMVEVEDASAGNRVDVRVRYPRNCNCDASIKFQVQVPRSLRLNFGSSTASGNIEVSGVSGDVNISAASGNVLVKNVAGEIKARTASGDVRVQDITGTVNAGSASGDVDVEIARLEGTGDMKFSTASGNVNVRLPANLDADIEMSSVSGNLETNFPIEIQAREEGPGKRARGRVGNGTRSLRLSSASGNVSLKSL
jgi:hypothetical protein